MTGLGDRKWKTDSVTVVDMDVTQSGLLHSDFMLVNTDTIDDIFNGIEVDIVRDALTGVEHVTSDKKNPIQLFPNPVKSVMSWNANANADQIKIYSTNGILLIQSSNILSGSINLSQLQSGMYFCQFCKGNQVIQTGKFVKE